MQLNFEKSASSLEVEQANEVYKAQHKNEAPRPSFYKTPTLEKIAASTRSFVS